MTCAEDEVHVWRAELDLAPAAIQSLRRTLSADELARVKRFHFDKDRKRFIAARGILKTILACYLGMEPGQVRFTYNPHGKPALAVPEGSHDEPPLQFNLSHTKELALYAIARGRRVGVDLEHIREDVECDKIAARFFSPHEQAQFQAIPAHPPMPRIVAFFTCWTRKEAYLKARGEGLSLGLDQFGVSLAPGEPARLLHTVGDSASRWSLRELEPGPGYVASLAVEGHDWRLACWQWP